MAKYDGTKCISCGNVFTDGDDVVVCPECGTPYHRECYNKEGKCINTELHEKNESWQPHYDEDTASANTDGEPIRCIRCGETNPPDGIFCKKCGMPLMKNTGEPRPFNDSAEYHNNSFGANGNNANGFYQGVPPYGAGQQMTFDQNSDIDGVKLGDYAKYVGKNPLVMLSNFIRFGKFGGKISINIGALIFPQFYFFYRKMHLIGVLFLLGTVISSIPRLILYGQSDMMGMVLLSANINTNTQFFEALLNLSSLIGMVLQFMAALFANFWYYKTARKNIIKIRASYGEDGSEEESVKQQIVEKGGTSMPAALLSVAVYFLINTFIIFMLNKYA